MSEYWGAQHERTTCPVLVAGAFGGTVRFAEEEQGALLSGSGLTESKVKVRRFSRRPELKSSKLRCGQSRAHLSAKWQRAFCCKTSFPKRGSSTCMCVSYVSCVFKVTWELVSVVWSVNISSWRACLSHCVGDHGYVEDLCFPCCLRPGHLPDVLLTSRPCQVRDAQHSHVTLHILSRHPFFTATRNAWICRLDVKSWFSYNYKGGIGEVVFFHISEGFK